MNNTQLFHSAIIKGMMVTLSIFMACTAAGQDSFIPVNRDSVKLLTSDSLKETYYQKLLERYNNFDSTLMLEEYRLLYYGFVFQPGYTGYPADKKKEIYTLIRKNKLDEAIELCDTVLKNSPIILSANYMKGLAMFMKDKNDPAHIKYRRRYEGLRDAILSTGDGLTCSSAYKTIYVSDEYELINTHFQIKSILSQTFVHPCDKFRVSASQKFRKNLIYFDTSETMRSMLGKY